MSLTSEQMEFLKSNPSRIPTIKSEVKELTTEEALRKVELKRAELEVLKIQKEMEKLEKPQAPETRLDYFEKMLTLQSQHNAQILDMQKQLFQLQIENEKLKAADGDGTDWITGLLPLVPEILKHKAAQQPSTANLPSQNVAPKPKEKKEVSKEMVIKKSSIKIPTAEELNHYKEGIKAGTISFEQFLADAKAGYPELMKLATEDQVREQYEKLKNS